MILIVLTLGCRGLFILSRNTGKQQFGQGQLSVFVPHLGQVILIPTSVIFGGLPFEILGDAQDVASVLVLVRVIVRDLKRQIAPESADRILVIVVVDVDDA